MSPSLSVDDRNVLVSSRDAKSDVADGMNGRMGLLTVDLAVDASDIDVDDLGVAVKMQIQYVLQHCRGYHVTFVASEVREKLKFKRHPTSPSALIMRAGIATAPSLSRRMTAMPSSLGSIRSIVITAYSDVRARLSPSVAVDGEIDLMAVGCQALHKAARRFPDCLQ